MHLPLLLFAAVAALIVGAWSWLGAPVAMPLTPVTGSEKLPCVSYAPFRGLQSPLSDATHIGARQIDDDLARLAKVTACIRTYSIEHGLDQVPEIARKHGLKVLQGLWLSSNARKNRWQTDGVIELVNKHQDVVLGVVVGNEVLLRGELSATAVAGFLREVKAAVPVPVTYADVWEFWVRNRDLAPLVDFVTIHILPYWEDFPIAAAQAAAHVDAIRADLAKQFSGKEILIGETGWPSAGRMREGALPSPSSQARVLHEVLGAAKRGNYRINVIEAFDQPWKRALEGTVGGHWGLYFDTNREPKFVWGAPLSDHPHWRLQAAGGVAFAALVFLAGWYGRRNGERQSLATWLTVALLAASAGVALGLTIEKLPLESLGLGGWLRGLLLAAASVAVPLIGAVALMRNAQTPSFAGVLGAGANRPADRLSLALGFGLIAVCILAVQAALGLVFDPRYKDFPYAPLAPAAIAYWVLAFARPRPAARGDGVSERLTAAVLGLSALYIVPNESLQNWQAVLFAVLLLVLTATLLRLAGVRNTE
jgi:glucan 1,3-beta-glucosidase